MRAGIDIRAVRRNRVDDPRITEGGASRVGSMLSGKTSIDNEAPWRFERSGT